MALENQTDAFIHFFKQMDIEMIDVLLDKDITYQNFEKPVFISKLQSAFDKFKDKGDTELFTIHGSCNSCNKCDTGLSFVGNNSGNYIDLIMQIKDNKIVDLFECTDFLNTDSSFKKKERIDIDKFEFNPNWDEDL